MPRRFILCDLDGTLVDSAGDLGDALNRLLSADGRRSLADQEVRRLIGDGTRALVAGGYAVTGRPIDGSALDAALARFMADYSAHATERTKPYPGVVETLASLRGDDSVLGICTNKPEGATRALLETLDLARYFSGISAGDSTTTRKPDPGHVRDALGRIGADPALSVMVGDSEHDVAAGRAAGLPTIAVTYGYAREPYATIGATRLIDRFADLPAALAAIGLS